ncbi:hypothetical protein K227x_19750 [Rubripirellula lacrimiformis]|uniref:Uncharacterized protein n=1 Tax=Rubripirellula lacrimiformis TaxID=1930273 RepID=A0A517N8Y8_9BACT|nr:hypothetical protein [Rubripirellula lacrimiformis]QDT03591.1 hypothetical protein K227x_19750 [Rubripirellula lacrimiformis]
MNTAVADMVLRDDRIIETVAMLHSRIEDRFPNSGLAGLCERLHVVACKASERSTAIAKPIRWLRVSGYLVATGLILALIAAVGLAFQNLAVRPTAGPETASPAETFGVLEWIQVIESGLNDIVFLAIAIFFLISLENRIKRRRALAAIHELRSIAHVIDMHQLTKDPERFFRNQPIGSTEFGESDSPESVNRDTKHSPRQSMTPFLLHRYLDYCSEMLSLTGKIAALYVQHFDDADAVAAVSEVEQLTTGLSRKIWQKIMILEQSRESLSRIDPGPATKRPKGNRRPPTDDTSTDQVTPPNAE